MGVHGLWSLIEPVGKPVPLESLENKVLAVDVSIWLHQAIKGYRDSNGSPLPNAHLLGLFHRVCKLLFYRVKPVFVFDGGIPPLKKQTLAARRAIKDKASTDIHKTAEKLLFNLVRQEALQKSLTNNTVPALLAQRNSKAPKDIFELPPMPSEPAKKSVIEEILSDEESEDEAVSLVSESYVSRDLHSVDFTSPAFQALPPEVQHEILIELKETRKQNSWAKLNDMPQEAGEFSGFQMQRLLKRRSLQQRLEDVTKSMNSQQTSDICLNGAFVETDSRKLASSDSVHFILAKRSPTKEIYASKMEPKKTSPPFLNLSEESVTPSGYLNVSKEATAVLEAQLYTGNDVSDSEDVSQTDILRLIQSEQKRIVNDESESSDFEEVQEVERLAVEPSKPALTIVLNPTQTQYKLEEDIFADIFKPTTVLSNELVQNQAKADLDQPNLVLLPDTPKDVITLEPDTLEDVVLIEPTVDMLSRREKNSFEHLKSLPVAINKDTAPAENIQILEQNVVNDVIDLEKNEIPEEISSMQKDYFEERDSYEDSSEEEELRTVTPPKQLTEKEIQALKVSLEREQNDLFFEKGKNERMATSITDQMHIEAQELLRLFGVPYIIAPMEAEAQCAFLDHTNLTQGTITEDSDIWLFGGQRVYKNMFNQGKYVERFELQDIRQVFKLTREQLVCLALLTGSDYTQGLETVGPVTALEILAEFPGEGLESLRNFRDWLLRVQAAQVTPPENRCRAKLKGLRLHSGFPSETVVQAYLKPEVDDSKEKFTWATPDEGALREFAREKFGWTTTKIDEILLPLMKRLNAKDTQTRLDSFFSIKFPMPVVKMSKRVATALNRVAGNGGSDEEMDQDGKPGSKRRASNGNLDITAKRKRVEVVSTPKSRLAEKLKNQLLKRVPSAKKVSQHVQPDPKEPKPSTSSAQCAEESEIDRIPQREKDRMQLEANKLQALQIWAQAKLPKEKMTRKRPNRSRKSVAKLEANLSESSDTE